MRQLLLAFLDGGPAHGYELKQRYDTLFAAVWPPVNIGQIYVTMGRLERDGLVEHRRVEQSDRPDRKVYELTDVGRKTLEAWLEEPPHVPSLDSELLLKLVAAREAHNAGASVAAIVSAHRQRCLEALRELDETLPDQTATDDGGLAALLIQGAALHLQAELRWLDLWESKSTRTSIRRKQ